MRTDEGHGRRATIKDIAERAGVSKGAVSYALNGRPGVSDETRARILAIADELGWYPNRAARALSASRADACGLVLARPATHDRARAVLHGVHRRRRGAALATLDRPDAPARQLRRGGDRGLPALVRRASRRRRVRRRPAARRPARRGAPGDGAACGRDRRAAPGQSRFRPSGTTRPRPWSRPCATSPRSAIAGSRGSRAWRSSSTPRQRTRAFRDDDARARPPTPRWWPPTTRPRAVPAQPGGCSRRRSRRRRSSSTAISSPSPVSASRSRWDSPFPTTSR